MFKNGLKTVVLAVLALCAGAVGPVYAGWLDSGFTAVDTCTVVNVSTSMQTGATQLLNAVPNGGYVLLFPKATGGITGEYLALDDSVNVSTAATGGSFQVPTGSLFTFADYSGPLWALAVGTTPVKVSVIRKR